jgi:hypothetical protein
VSVLILVGALFPLDGGRRREGKKKKEKIHHEKVAGCALMSVQKVPAVRCI